MSNEPPKSDFKDKSQPNIEQNNQGQMSGGMQSVFGNRNIQTQDNRRWYNLVFNLIIGQYNLSKYEKILLLEVKYRVSSWLKQSLHNAIFIDILKIEQPDQIELPWDAEIKVGSQYPKPLADISLLEVFDREDIGGRLLILGLPGSGKTTTMLNLVHTLIERVEKDEEYPVPVILNLSTWKIDYSCLEEWLTNEMKAEYGIRSDIGIKLIKERRLLPILDGLDEVKPLYQDSCVHAINQFLHGDNRPIHFIICSRKEEYENIGIRLLLRGAINLKPLTYAQIGNYLSQVNKSELWKSIKLYDELVELVSRPLFLSIAAIASQEINIPQWRRQNSYKERLQYLLDAYVICMEKRAVKSAQKKSLPSSQRTRFWLIWLARYLERNFTSNFMIEELQSNSLFLKRHQRLYGLISKLFFVTIFGLIFCGAGVFVFGILMLEGREYEFRDGLVNILNDSLQNGLIQALYFGFMGGLIVGVVAGCITLFMIGFKYEIVLIETLRWSWRRALEAWNKGARVIISFLAPLLLLVGPMPLEYKAPLFSIIFFPVAISAYANGIIDPKITFRKFPNQGIYRSVRNSLIGGSLYAVIVFLLFVLIIGKGIDENWRLSVGFLISLFSGLTCAFYCGGNAYVKNFVLRCILYFNGYIPWNYAKFLDHCTERLFLQRIGGRYRFIHKLVQEHFAEMYLTKLTK